MGSSGCERDGPRRRSHRHPGRGLDTVAVGGEETADRHREGGTVPVVLVHGNVSPSVHSDVLFEALDDRCAVYAPDLRGFGDSSHEEPIDSVPALVTLPDCGHSPLEDALETAVAEPEAHFEG